jgi:integration host factor subunit beta
MTKAELVDQIAMRTGLTKRQTEEVLGLFLQCIVEALQTGDKVELRGFGSFRCRSRAPRQGCNPRTAEAVAVPGKRVPLFKAGKPLHERLNPELTSAGEPARV